jgi:hypothetical protein
MELQTLQHYSIAESATLIDTGTARFNLKGKKLIGNAGGGTISKIIFYYFPYNSNILSLYSTPTTPVPRNAVVRPASQKGGRKRQRLPPACIDRNNRRKNE